jgi:predicted RNA-binding Zn-ribbon protein involved in translation (DUF1610 family)
MQTIVLVTLAILAASAIAGAGLKSGAAARRARADAPTSARLKSMTQSEVEKLLARVESTAAPEPVEGAMCYAAMPMESTAEYLCPICGEKTIYGADQAWLVTRQIESARRYVEQITALSSMEVLLDETGFCSFCSGADSGLALVLRVVYEEGDTVSSEVTDFDLQLLAGLFSKSLTYNTFNDGQMPLQPYLGRLREVLGLPAGAE